MLLIVLPTPNIDSATGTAQDGGLPVASIAADR